VRLLSADGVWGALDRTWPAKDTFSQGGFVIRNGAGGGKRVSAATLDGPLARADIAAAERANASLNQPNLFMIRSNEAELDHALDHLGYAVVDPVAIYAAPIAHLQADIPPVAVFSIWAPLAIQRDIWAEGGIGSARLNVMDRATGPKTSLLGRVANRPAGTTFVACDGNVAMLHSLEVVAGARRNGLGRLMMHGAANWAAANGAEVLALAVTTANVAANRLYTSMGMEVVEKYHYRMKGEISQ
jgi:GNAT superfamily N-acetyltransferase